jgi:hypothetical protein
MREEFVSYSFLGMTVAVLSYFALASSHWHLPNLCLRLFGVIYRAPEGRALPVKERWPETR